MVEVTVVYRVNGKEVTRRDFNRNPKGLGQIRRSWEPSQVIKSDGASVHPSDREAAMDHAKRNGVPTFFDTDGRPHFKSLRHQTKYLRKIGMHNNDGVH